MSPATPGSQRGRTRRGLWPVLVPVLLCVGWVTLALVRSPKETPITRGLAVARRMGCFGCHGPGGEGGRANPASSGGEIPPLRAGAAFASFARDPGEIREWILEGRPRRLDAPATGPGLIQMPAYADFLAEGEIDDLVAFVESLACGRPPSGSPAADGLRAIEELGCTACHGASGVGELANPGSFKGCIPPWDGEDFEELVRDDDELREWIRGGEIARFRSNPLACFFLDRQALKMPGYADRCSASEVEAIVAYVHWLRDDRREVAPPLTREEPAPAGPIARGAWLYGRWGCVDCHGAGGRGGVPNDNAPGGFVPALVNTAERMGLVERSDVESLLAAVEHGGSLEARLGELPDGELVHAGYLELRRTILCGSRPARRDADGPEPPMLMPAWGQRSHSSQEPLSLADLDALIAYLLSLEPEL